MAGGKLVVGGSGREAGLVVDCQAAALQLVRHRGGQFEGGPEVNILADDIAGGVEGGGDFAGLGGEEFFVARLGGGDGRTLQPIP